MLNPVHFSHEQALFEALVTALDESDAFESVEARDEQDGYGNKGIIVVEVEGRKFLLNAYEVI